MKRHFETQFTLTHRPQQAFGLPATRIVVRQITDMLARQDKRQRPLNLLRPRRTELALKRLIRAQKPIRVIDPVTSLYRRIAGRRIIEQRMPRRAVQMLGFTEQLAVVEGALYLREVADRQVQPLLQQQALHLAGHCADQLDAHRLITLAKAPDRFGDPLQH